MEDLRKSIIKGYKKLRPGPKQKENANTQFIFVRVHRSVLLPIPAIPASSSSTSSPPASSLPASSLPTHHLYLIEGTFGDISRYAGITVDWLIKISLLICDPLGTGRLYTHTTGTASDWYDLDKTSSWRQVVPGDQLLPGIYEFESANPIMLTKISERHMHSITSDGHQSSSTTFGRHIRIRDGQKCVVTSDPHNVIPSHLIPKRLGTNGARDVVTRFSGPQEALGIHDFDPRIGILLTGNLDVRVDHYQLGFYHVAGNTYTLHNFFADEPDITILGFSPTLLNATPLHLFTVTLSVHGGNSSLPPVGVFNWHYLQCVIQVFGTPAYKSFLNITLYAHPFRTADDNDLDDEYTDDGEAGPLYPSYNFDRYLKEQGRRQMALERHAEVELWASGIPSDI